MAPAAQAPLKRATYDGSRPRFSSIEAWLNSYGIAEYAIYRRDAAPEPLNYEEWTQSDHVLGPFLWHTTLDVWEEDSSSEEESEIEAPKSIAQTLSKPQPKKLVILNGGKKRNSAKSAASPVQSTSGDATIATKRKRKAKKPYLSEDIVVSDVSDELEEPDLITEARPFATNVPVSPGDGRRKSGGRKKKQYLSAETVLSEDEDDDSKPSNGTTATTSSHDPSAPVDDHITVTAVSPAHSKGKRGKKPKKKSLSQLVTSRDDEKSTDVPTDAAATPNNTAASPEGPGSSSRRGLRTRTPAQQRPYFHNAQVFDELVSDEPEPEKDTNLSLPMPKPKQKLKLTNLANVSYLGDSKGNSPENDEETVLMYDIGVNEEATFDAKESQPTRKAHYKGKGRAWKKTSDDEDEDYQSPVKVKSSQPKKKPGQRKSNQTTEILPEVEELTELQQQEEEDGEENVNNIESTSQNSLQKTGKRKQRRAHHLSEEFVQDEDDLDDTPEGFGLAGAKDKRIGNDFFPATRLQKTPKKKGRRRKSDQEFAPQDSASIDNTRLASGNGNQMTKKSSPPSREALEKGVEAVPLSRINDKERGSGADTITEDGQDDVTPPEEKGNSNTDPPLAESTQVTSQ